MLSWQLKYVILADSDINAFVHSSFQPTLQVTDPPHCKLWVRQEEAEVREEPCGFGGWIFRWGNLFRPINHVWRPLKLKWGEGPPNDEGH